VRLGRKRLQLIDVLLNRSLFTLEAPTSI